MLAVYALASAIAVACGVITVGRELRQHAARHEAYLIDLSTRDLASLFLFVGTATLVRASAVAFIAVLSLTLALTGRVTIAVAAAACTWLLPSLLVRALRRRRLSRLLRQLPDALDAWAMSLRAGMAVNQAIAQIAQQLPPPLCQEFLVLSRENRVGVTLDRTLQGFAERVPLPEVALLVTTVRVAREAGGSLAESLDRLAVNLRRKLALQDKIRALTAQGRIQGIVVAALPIVVMLALFWLQPQSMEPLLTTATGWATLGVIAGLEVLGYYLIRRIVSIEV
jgi:tight adherence protein B